MLRNRLALALCLLPLAAAPPALAEEFDLEGLLSGGPSSADNTADDGGEARPPLPASSCDRYGPGYEPVPGTTTCVKVGGHVQVDVYTRSRR